MATDKVNVHSALNFGEIMASKFRNKLPQGFCDHIQSKVVSMETMKEGVKIGERIMHRVSQKSIAV